jgi:crossover junction endodeoxyribonuclease RuvC
MRVLGIDPGLQNMGWGLIEVQGVRIRHVRNGIVHSGRGFTLAERLLALYDQLRAVVSEEMPDHAAVEQTFVNKDAVGTLKLGQARGIALLVPAQFGIPVGEYAPNAVKKAVVGVGHAAKAQIDHMVRLHLPGVTLAGPGRRGRAGRRDLPRPSSAVRHASDRRHREGRGPRGSARGRRRRARRSRRRCGAQALIGRVAGAAPVSRRGHVLIDVRGVGYLVHVSDRVLAALPATARRWRCSPSCRCARTAGRCSASPRSVEKEWYRSS